MPASHSCRCEKCWLLKFWIWSGWTCLMSCLDLRYLLCALTCIQVVPFSPLLVLLFPWLSIFDFLPWFPRMLCSFACFEHFDLPTSTIFRLLPSHRTLDLILMVVALSLNDGTSVVGWISIWGRWTHSSFELAETWSLRFEIFAQRWNWLQIASEAQDLWWRG